MDGMKINLIKSELFNNLSCYIVFIIYFFFINFAVILTVMNLKSWQGREMKILMKISWMMGKIMK